MVGAGQGIFGAKQEYQNFGSFCKFHNLGGSFPERTLKASPQDVPNERKPTRGRCRGSMGIERALVAKEPCRTKALSQKEPYNQTSQQKTDALSVQRRVPLSAQNSNKPRLFSQNSTTKARVFFQKKALQ